MKRCSAGLWPVPEEVIVGANVPKGCTKTRRCTGQVLKGTEVSFNCVSVKVKVGWDDIQAGLADVFEDAETFIDSQISKYLIY